MKNSKISLLALFVFLMAFTAECATLYKNYGKIEPNGKVTQSLELYQIDPDLNYYISGSASYPNAIIGLKNSYTLDSDRWKKIEMTPAVLKDLVSNMQSRALQFGGYLQGSVILDDKGRQLGIWYSLLDVNTFVKMEDENTVIINTPPLDTFNKHENGDDKNDK